MKRIILIIFMIAASCQAYSQQVLTLKECYRQAGEKNALALEQQAYTEIWQLKDKNLSKGWLPTLDANGSFVYNSSVIDLSDMMGALPIPGISDLIPALPHEQYKVTVDINQVIYDGGAIKATRALEKADLAVNRKQTETDLYKLRSQINGYYFNLLLLERQKELLDNYLQLINKRIGSMKSALHEGIILKSDLDVLTAEQIRLEQQITENEIRKSALIKILSGMIGVDIDNLTTLVLPEPTEEFSHDLLRPELEIFDLRNEQLSATRAVIQSKRMPRAFGFATLGYGNPPGNNFFRDEFAPYAVLGAGVKWNILDWNKVKNEQQVISLQQGILENRKTDLTDNLTRMLDAKQAEIASLKTLIETDTGLIEIRKRITAAAESQYDNGTLTATEYLQELNTEKQAVINHEIHIINLALARIEYLNISGKEIE